jgi:hypothetical protein
VASGDVRRVVGTPTDLDENAEAVVAYAARLRRDRPTVRARAPIVKRVRVEGSGIATRPLM